MFAVSEQTAQLSAATRSSARLSAKSRRTGLRTQVTMAASPKVAPAVIIGGGRVGFALEKLGDGEDVVRDLLLCAHTGSDACALPYARIIYDALLHRTWSVCNTLWIVLGPSPEVHVLPGCPPRAADPREGLYNCRRQGEGPLLS